MPPSLPAASVQAAQPAHDDGSRLRAATASRLLVLASLVFGLMAFVAKRAMLRLPGAQVAFMRFVVGLAGVGLASLGGVSLRPVGLRPLLLRGVFGGVSVLLFFVAIEKLPVGTATLLNYTSPVFIAVDAAIFLREEVSLPVASSLALTLLGVALVVSGTSPPATVETRHLGALGGTGPWVLCGLVSAILSGAAVTAVRAARKTDNAWVIFGAFCFFGLLATAPFALASWRSPTGAEWLLLFLVGALSLLAQVLFTQALRDAQAAVAGVIMQLTPVTALFLGVAVSGDRATPVALLGSALTVAGAGFVAYRQALRQRAG